MSGQLQGQKHKDKAQQDQQEAHDRSNRREKAWPDQEGLGFSGQKPTFAI